MCTYLPKIKFTFLVSYYCILIKNYVSQINQTFTSIWQVIAALIHSYFFGFIACTLAGIKHT